MRKAESNILSDKAIMELYKVNRKAGNEAAIEKYSKYIYKIIHSFKNFMYFYPKYRIYTNLDASGFLKP